MGRRAEEATQCEGGMHWVRDRGIESASGRGGQRARGRGGRECEGPGEDEMRVRRSARGLWGGASMDLDWDGPRGARGRGGASGSQLGYGGRVAGKVCGENG